MRLIEAYFDDRLTVVERKSFETSLEQDPVLRENFRVYRDSLLAMKVLEHKETRKEFQRMYANAKAGKTGKSQKQVIAFGVCVVAILGVLFLTQLWKPSSSSVSVWPSAQSNLKEAAPSSQTVDPYEMSTDVFEPYGTGPALTRKSGLKDSREAYQNRDFEDAIPSFEDFLSKNPSRTDVAFYLGVSYLGDSQPTKAIKTLTPLINDDQYAEKARWYLALAYFRGRMNIQGLGLMEKISNSRGHFNQAEAELFLDSMK